LLLFSSSASKKKEKEEEKRKFRPHNSCGMKNPFPTPP
jgi:hypothetical protein